MDNSRGPGQNHVRHAAIYDRIDILTGLYATWSYIHVHRAIVAFAALADTPTAPPPQPHGVSTAEYACAHNHWIVQASIDSDEARFAREMQIPVSDERGHVSLRAYVRGLDERMADAGRRGLFEDLDDYFNESSDAAPARDREGLKNELIVEARACLTFALAHDVRWRRLVMRPPGHLFRERAPDVQRVRAFVDHCVELTRAFVQGAATLHDVADDAAERWLY